MTKRVIAAVCTLALLFGMLLFGQFVGVEENQKISLCEEKEESLVVLPEEVGQTVLPEESLEQSDSLPVFLDFETAAPEEHLIPNFPILYQMPELPTGCEITALTMVLHYYGYDVDKTTMAGRYLPTVPASFSYGADGRRYGGDLQEYFVGDPFRQLGYICGTPAIVTAANDYLADAESTLRAVDYSGSTPEELYELVSEDVPVVVWVTIGMADRRETQGWYIESGDYVEWSTNDHGAVLIGYSDSTVTIADPIAGVVEYDRQQFESVFVSRQNQCVVLEEMG